jgi:uncharacterized repeat protein (TIGR03803 family)
MRSKASSNVQVVRARLHKVGLALAAIICVLGGNARAQTETVLYTFAGGEEGASPYGLTFNAAGELYGTALGGDLNDCPPYGCGVVFDLSSGSSGWTEAVAHYFTGGTSGGGPTAALVFDASGDLFGGTASGGNLQECVTQFYSGCGVVFELSPTSGGGWKETVLHRFTGGKDGAYPEFLVFDAAGNLYGVANGGGSSNCIFGCGAIFKLTLTSDGWRMTVLHLFTGTDGAYPNGVVLDSAGNLYGTTQEGGLGNGVVFKLSPVASGGWKETVLHRFTNGQDGGQPYVGPILDEAGNLYGTTVTGGSLSDCSEARGCGVVFQLSPTSSGGWHETLLHTFTGGSDGWAPFALIRDTAGNLYGTTLDGGNLDECSGNGCGVVFELSPNSGSGWTEAVLHTFTGGADGSFPGPIFDLGGNLYGTTTYGGTSGEGVVYEITP